MDEVADRNHLQERNGVWYYRRRVPPDLVRSFGSHFVKKSLKTGLIKEAQQRRNILDVRFDAELAELRKSARTTSVTPPSAKSEMIWRTIFQTRAAAELALGRYIDGFYNPRRRHSALGYKSPVSFEAMMAIIE